MKIRNNIKPIHRHLLLTALVLQLFCSREDVYNNMTDRITEPPVVNITSPLDGELADDILTITAEAYSIAGIKSVEFYIDSILIGQDNSGTPYEFSYNTNLCSNGVHNIRVVAYDNNGNTARDDDTSVTFSNAEKPEVNILTPISESTVSETVNVTASAFSVIGIDRVEFYANDIKIGEDNSNSPYRIDWDTSRFDDGSYKLKAVAYDNNGNMELDEDITVYVDNSHITPIRFGPLDFDLGAVGYVSASSLNNGNFVIAYQALDDSGKGKFKIYDPSGNIVTVAGNEATTFNNSNTSHISAATFKNGNFIIAYNDGFGNFLIYDRDGTQVKNKTTFFNGYAYYTSLTSHDNGNVILTFNHGWNNYIAIIDSSGDFIKPADSYETADFIGVLSWAKPVCLTNGDVLIAYKYMNEGKFKIFNELCSNLLVPMTTFASSVEEYSSVISLNNGNILFAYQDFPDDEKGKFKIYDASGDMVKSETIFNGSYSDSISLAATIYGEVLIFYKDFLGNNNFKIYSQTGDVLKSATSFDAGISLYNSAIRLNNGDIVVAYQDFNGQFVILNKSFFNL